MNTFNQSAATLTATAAVPLSIYAANEKAILNFPHSSLRLFHVFLDNGSVHRATPMIAATAAAVNGFSNDANQNQ